MRCQCCNRNLSDYESTLRHPETLQFLDICKKCLVDIPIKPVEGNNAENTDFDDDPVAQDIYEGAFDEGYEDEDGE